MNKSTKSVLKYVLEFLIVGFGVFLGIYASEWQSNKKIKETKEKSIAYILKEVEVNQANLLKRIEYHEMIKVRFDSMRETISEEDILKPYLENKKFRHQNIPGWTGMGLPDFEDVAFEGAKLTGIIQEYNIELTQEISKVYKRQEFTSEIGKSILDKALNINSSTKTSDVIGVIELLTTDFVNGERGL